MSCDELMGELAAYETKVEEAVAEAVKHGASVSVQQALERRLRESAARLVREIDRRCPVMIEPRILR